MSGVDAVRTADPEVDARAARAARGRELAAVLELAGLFPARHEATLAFPPFAASR